MGSRIVFCWLVIYIQILVIAAQTNNTDFAALMSLKHVWKNTPPSWIGSDPCGDSWEGIGCNNSSVTSIMLSSMSLTGELSGDISSLSELQTVDLSYNKELTGSLPSSIGKLTKLSNLILVGCGFTGLIPDTIGSLQQLVFLSLNSNNFSGPIPPSIGNLSKLLWLDLADNQLSGTIPVSNGITPGLDMLVNTKHFHFGINQLSGEIPSQLFSSNMTLIHMIFDNNKFTGNIPTTLGLVQTLLVLRLDRNSLSGPIPTNLNKLTRVQQLLLSNNRLTGPMPNLTDMNSLTYVDMSNNTFDVSNIQPWFSSLLSLTTFILSHNRLNGALDIGSRVRNQLKLINLQNNLISEFTQKEDRDTEIILVQNPICEEVGREREKYCMVPQGKQQSNSAYSTPPNNCVPAHCSSNKLSSPNYHFNRTEISRIGFVLSNQTFKAPKDFGPFTFIGDAYEYFADVSTGTHKSGIIIGAAIGGSVLVLLLLLAGVYAFHQKKRAERATKQNNPFASWDSNTNSGGIPQLKGARSFSFQEIKKYTNNFSEANEIGTGGYGKVYRGTLPTGQLVAIKRAQHGSMQGGVEFKTEIELLSRVHHKNVVSLLGFCFEQGEQMLVYEYVPNGSLKESLSGKSRIRLDWMRRLRIALGAARGLSYLHELANPPIIHRDIKSNNILLDERLNAKVGDFGLSKPMVDAEKDHVTTQIKGTMGYLDPEYYMTQQLTEKSDVYSFGVLMLELLTAKRPIEKGKYIVREVKQMRDKTKDLYNLHEILDPTIGLGMPLKGFERFVDLAMWCVEDSRPDRPTMSEVVKEIENIMQLAGLNPNAESASTSASYEETSMGGHPYSNENLFSYSEGFPPPKLEP
ncbi:hypothetical protein F0562_020148 [Nyssa sinensis]|uniref:non-specific serine/threonine protein kinase n=1 Tax=Nyssa sinensis TaxID=561372 RepID=A0A5J5BRP4_9ASTE|nr:hypothetical protein F0562_020148 [Nyssa sinensis]